MMVRIALLGIAGVLLALHLKTLKSEYAVFVALAVSVLILFSISDQLSLIMAGFDAIRESLPIDAGYIQILLKIIGITYIAEFASDLCKDAGFQTVAGQIQVFGKLSVLAVSIPVLTALLGTIQDFLGG